MWQLKCPKGSYQTNPSIDTDASPSFFHFRTAWFQFQSLPQFFVTRHSAIFAFLSSSVVKLYCRFASFREPLDVSQYHWSISNSQYHGSNMKSWQVFVATTPNDLFCLITLRFSLVYHTNSLFLPFSVQFIMYSHSVQSSKTHVA